MKKSIFVSIAILIFIIIVLSVLLYQSEMEQKELQGRIISDFSDTFHLLILNTEDVLEGTLDWGIAEDSISSYCVELDVLTGYGSNVYTSYFRKMGNRLDGPNQLGKYIGDWRKLYDELQRNKNMDRDQFTNFIEQVKKLEETLS